MTYVAIAQKLQPFVHILQHPQIGLQVERVYVVVVLFSVLKDGELNVGAATPVLLACFRVATDVT